MFFIFYLWMIVFLKALDMKEPLLNLSIFFSEWEQVYKGL